MTTTTAIVTRTKDRPLLLRRAIDGILAQSCGDWTHVIVNDGGERKEVDALAREFSAKYGSRLRVVHNTESQGMEAASNMGIAASQSDFILIHDDDDSLHPEFIERTMSYLERAPRRSIMGVATLSWLVKERIDGARVSELRKKLLRELPPCLLASDVAVSNPIPPISFLFRREAYQDIGPFDESLPVLGDWEFLLRFIARFDVAVIQAPLANYHVRASTQGTMANSITGGLDQHRLYDRLVRNRFFRECDPALGLLLQQGSDEERARRQLQRLYDNAAIGGFIRLWSRFVNSAIPRSP